MKGVVFAAVLMSSCFPGARADAADELREVCAPEKCFQSEVMDTPAGRTQGLMSRDGLAENEGMLFVFDQPGEFPFWMKNMNFPIDIAWLDGEKRVVHVERNVPPCLKDPCPVYSPGAIAVYVLEVGAGQAEAAGMIPGSQLTWN